MNDATVSNLWWIDVLQSVGSLTPTDRASRADYLRNNPVYARSLARAYLADIRPPQQPYRSAVKENPKAA